MNEIQKNLPKDMKLSILRDDSYFIQESIHEVEYSLVLSTILVLAIIFIFLGSLRASLIPAVTVPISLI